MRDWSATDSKSFSAATVRAVFLDEVEDCAGESNRNDSADEGNEAKRPSEGASRRPLPSGEGSPSDFPHTESNRKLSHHLEIDKPFFRVRGNQLYTHAISDIQMSRRIGKFAFNWWRR